MRLDALIGTKLAGASADVEVSSLAYDSHRVKPGALFFCVPGFKRDGHDFALEAVRAGAVALVVERRLDLGATEVLVESVRAAMVSSAARFYGEPARTLRVIGVTGTNGKTTTTYLIRALLEATGSQCGLLGTVKSVIAGRERAVERTTAESLELQADLRAMLDGGDRACAMEVSSHALELGRVAAIPFAAAVFTNLTQDHLDFHGTMEDYFQAKRRLFKAPTPSISVINVADPYGRRLAQETDGAITYAVDAPADYRAVDLSCDLGGCGFTLHTPDGEREVRLPMPGRFNVANALAALATVHALGGEEPEHETEQTRASRLDRLVVALAHGVRVPGRLEPVEEGQTFAVLVDYAHTPDSLENVLRAAREVLRSSAQAATGQPGEGRLLCVFGAGGDRDRGKRPLMGEIGARLADLLIVTSDNPRSEDPRRIVEEIMDGARAASDRPAGVSSADIQAIIDRKAAIDEAILHARDGDVVVIAGKGHEQGQELAGGRKIPFDDVSVARDALRMRLGAP
jgi:UDP-N-acetylmuramoyl-L-alanyl-D-glutamate--2,6-diaminopimelate ligase